MRKDFKVILRHLDLFGINRGSNSFAEWCADKLLEDFRINGGSLETKGIEALNLLYQIYKDAGGMDAEKLET